MTKRPTNYHARSDGVVVGNESGVVLPPALLFDLERSGPGMA